MAMTITRDRRKFATLGLLASGISVLGCYLAYKYWPSTANKEKGLYHDKGKKCVVVTKGVKEGLDLEPLIKGGSVLLITPGLLLSEGLEELQGHNVIECESWQGVWSCIRHLRPIELVIKEDDIPEGMPKDMQRYFTQITRL